MFTRENWILNARVGSLLLVAFTFFAVLPPESRAALAESRLSGGEAVSERAGQIETIRQALELEIVSQRLADYGMSKEEILAKLPTLSDQQIHQLAGLSGTLAEGGDGLGIVVTLLVIVLLVVLILRIHDKQIIIR